jgi:hypothetical protein
MSLRSKWAAGKARGGRISKLIRNRRATRPPAHFQRNPPGRGQLAVFPRCSLLTYQFRYARHSRLEKQPTDQRRKPCYFADRTPGRKGTAQRFPEQKDSARRSRNHIVLVLVLELENALGLRVGLLIDKKHVILTGWQSVAFEYEKILAKMQDSQLKQIKGLKGFLFGAYREGSGNHRL